MDRRARVGCQQNNDKRRPREMSGASPELCASTTARPLNLRCLRVRFRLRRTVTRTENAPLRVRFRLRNQKLVNRATATVRQENSFNIIQELPLRSCL